MTGYLADRVRRRVRAHNSCNLSSSLPRFPQLPECARCAVHKCSQCTSTRDMVDWKSRELHIPRTKNEEPLHVPLNDAAMAALNMVFEAGDGKGRVYRSKKTVNPLESGRRWFDDAVVEARLKELSLARLATYLREPTANERHPT